MKKLIWLPIFLLALGVTAMAQDYPKAEVFGGYSYTHLSEAGDALNFNGGSASLSVNPNQTLGLVADVGVSHTSSFGADANLFTYLFGPKLAMRSNDKFTPYVHALFGGARLSGGGSSSNAFAMALGGGLDAKVNNNVAIRLGQVEYMMTRFSGGDGHQNGVRVSAGVVFRF